jgi:TolB protein
MKSLVSWDGEAGESEAGARFSPNGTMIAYSLTKNGQRNIWTKQVPDGKPNPITDGKWNYFNPIWSADGQRIAFVSNRDNQLAIWAMPFSGGELTPISAIEGGSVTLLQWSKNGGTIYFQQGYNFFGLDIASRQISQLTHFDEINQAQFFSLSPNEDRIAYSAGPNEQLRLFVMDLKGRQSVQITNDDASDEYPFWLPDGERIIYSSKRDGIFQTCIAYLNENRREQLNLGITDTLISDVASGGDKILFRQSREESDLWQVTIDSKSETQITTDSGLELWSDASSDGKNIVFQATTESTHLFGGSIVIRSTDDNQQINITSNGFSPTYSPDGRRVAFLRYADNHVNIWAASRTGADERQLTTDGIRFSGFTFMPYNRVQIKDYSWSPDGNSLIYSAKRSGVWNVWLVRADGTGEPRQLTQNSDETVQVSCPLFAPDGKRIAYTVGPLRPTSESETTIKLANVDGGDGETLFTSGSLFRLLCWERSGKGLLIAMSDDRSSAKPTRVKLVHIAPGNSRTELAVVAATYFNNIQFSPDGKKIAYAAHENGKDNIKVISTSGGESTTTLATADPNVYVSGLAWSPDSKTVYYGKQKKIRTISMIENFK